MLEWELEAYVENGREPVQNSKLRSHTSCKRKQIHNEKYTF